MAERRSAPRKADVEVDEEARTRRERLLLIVLVIGGAAIIQGMVLISNFLSGDGSNISKWQYVAIGATVGVMLIFLGFEWIKSRRSNAA